MKWPIALLAVVLTGAGVAAWFVFMRGEPSTGAWAVAESGCYVPIGSPSDPAPGAICGTLEALGYCRYEGRDYAPGERFAASDGCNSCTCDPSTQTVRCTTEVCEDDDANVAGSSGP